MTQALREAVFEFAPVRWVVGVFFLCRGHLHLRRGRLYRALLDYCWIERVSRLTLMRRLVRGRIFSIVAETKRTGRNPVVESYRNDPASDACAAIYSLTGRGGPHDLWRDVIVLKKATSAEKGVILLKYVRTFDAMVSMFDLDRLMARYTFVLEPCWAGYCLPSVLAFVTAKHPVIVQCFTEADYQFISAIGAPFVPVRLGPASWVDGRLFRPGNKESKRYDLVMVANWARHKRHATLFRALERITDRRIRVLLIGFPLGDRTAADMRREAAAIRNPQVEIEVVEKIPAADVASYVRQSKVFVFLSRKEGDNKALVEAMFADVPSIVYAGTVGGAPSRINAQTGIFSSDADLANNIRYMLEHYSEFTPAAWAQQNAGSAISTSVLNAALKQSVIAAGGGYVDGIVEKVNSPNLAYLDPSCRTRFQADYEYIIASRLGLDERAGAAVA